MPTQLANRTAYATHQNTAPETCAIVRLLIKGGAGVNVRNKDGSTALMFAARYGRLEVVQLLIARGADVNAKDNQLASCD